MAGIAILVDLWRKNPSFCSPHVIHSSVLFSATSAAASAAAAAPFASRFLFSSRSVAHCDAGATVAEAAEDYISNIHSNIRKVSASIFQHDAIKYTPKEYSFQLKPLFSAFESRALAMTSLRSFLIFYLPLLEPDTNTEEDDELDAPEVRHVDLVVPFKKSVKQIARETTVVTTRRLLERLAVHYVSQRTAWKLLKDIPQSAVRKAQRGLPTSLFIIGVGKTTLRGHCLGVAASWLVQVGIEIYRYFYREGSKSVEEAKILWKKVSSITVRCGSSLIFASIGAGIGAALIRPSVGQWLGCAVGDLTGPIIVTFCLDKALHLIL